MANDAKKVSELSVISSTALSANDRVLVVHYVSGIPNTVTTSVANLSVSIAANMPTATANTAGSVKIGNNIIVSNGTISVAFPHEQMFVLGEDHYYSNSSSSQSMFFKNVTLQSNTRYQYKIIGTIYRPSGSSNSSIKYSITDSSTTAVLTNHYFTVDSFTSSTQGTVSSSYKMSNKQTSSFSSLVPITPDQASPGYYSLTINGVLDVGPTGAGSLNPQMSYSNTNGQSNGGYIQAGSFVSIWPIGNSTVNTSLGTWS